jgi:hypothetical protein
MITWKEFHQKGPCLSSSLIHLAFWAVVVCHAPLNKTGVKSVHMTENISWYISYHIWRGFFFVCLFSFIFLWYWRLNLGPHNCYADTIQLKPLPQSKEEFKKVYTAYCRQYGEGRTRALWDKIKKPIQSFWVRAVKIWKNLHPRIFFNIDIKTSILITYIHAVFNFRRLWNILH